MVRRITPLYTWFGEKRSETCTKRTAEIHHIQTDRSRRYPPYIWLRGECVHQPSPTQSQHVEYDEVNPPRKWKIMVLNLTLYLFPSVRHTIQWISGTNHWHWKSSNIFVWPKCVLKHQYTSALLTCFRPGELCSILSVSLLWFLTSPNVF